jgi:PAS domain S-box-containing protein
MARPSRRTLDAPAPLALPRATPPSASPLANEHDIRALLDSFDVGVALQGPRAEMQFANKVALDWFGLTHEQISGRTTQDLGFNVLREDGTECPFHMRPVPRAIESREPVLKQVLGWQRPGSGSLLWIQVTSVPQFAQEGTLTGVITSFTDITALKNVEAALRTAAELNRQIVSSAQEGIIVHGSDLRYKLWNPYMERMSGLKAADVVGKHPLELFPFMAEVGIYADLEKALAGEIVSSHDSPFFVPQTKREGWMNNNFAPLRDDKGNIIGVVATVRDITQRKREEEQLRRNEALLSQAEQMTKCGSWESNLKTGTWSLSKGLLQIYGLASAPEWDREDYWARIHPADRKRARARIHRAVAECKPFEHVLRYRAPDGVYRVHFARAIQIPGPDGRTERSIGVVQDITDQTRKEEDLRQLSARLLRLQDEERRRIARDLHDSVSQKLLTVSLSLVQLGKSAHVQTKRGKQLLADTRGMVKDLSTEVRSLSYLLHPPLLDELGLVSALEEYASGFGRRSGLRLELDLSSEVGRLPKEYNTALFRIVQESLGNIQKHSGSPAGRIRLMRDGNKIVLEVMDGGRGIPPDHLKERPGGLRSLGVGILGMRERMTQIGGRLEITSGSEGTTVRATLPLPADFDHPEASRRRE